MGHFGHADHIKDRLKAWRIILLLAETNEIGLNTISRYLSKPRDWEVLKARFIDQPPETHVEIGRWMGCSPQAIEQIECRALLRLLTRLVTYDYGVRKVEVGIIHA